jgi:hypothetical protein
MDLEKQTRILPFAKTGQSTNSVGQPTEVSLFVLFENGRMRKERMFFTLN